MRQETLNRCSYQEKFGNGYRCRLTELVAKRKRDLVCSSQGVPLDDLNDCAAEVTGQTAHSKKTTLRQFGGRRIGGHGNARGPEKKVENDLD